MTDLRVGMVVEVSGFLLKKKEGRKVTQTVWTIPAQGRVRGLLLGTSLRFDGRLDGGWNDYDPIEFVAENWQQVWMVQPFYGNRYRKPLAVLERQIFRVVQTQNE